MSGSTPYTQLEKFTSGLHPHMSRTLQYSTLLWWRPWALHEALLGEEARDKYPRESPEISVCESLRTPG